MPPSFSSTPVPHACHLLWQGHNFKWWGDEHFPSTCCPSEYLGHSPGSYQVLTELKAASLITVLSHWRRAHCQMQTGTKTSSGYWQKNLTLLESAGLRELCSGTSLRDALPTTQTTSGHKEQIGIMISSLVQIWIFLSRNRLMELVGAEFLVLKSNPQSFRLHSYGYMANSQQVDKIQRDFAWSVVLVNESQTLFKAIQASAQSFYQEDLDS